MKTGKRLIGILLTLALVLTYLPLPTRAAEIVDGSAPGASLVWTLYSDGLLEISGTGEMTYCDIESSVPWHNYRSQIKRVTIAEGITSITNFAFKDCHNLVSVEIPDSVTTIANKAFYECTKLRQADLPAGLTSIGSFAFYMCEDLRQVEFGSSLTSIGEYAFNMCRDLSVVVFPASVTSIGTYCFQACDSLNILQFLGDPPDFYSNIFPDNFDVTCYYPAGNAAWDGHTTGSVTWVPFEPGDSIFPAELEPAAGAPAAPLAPGTVLGSGSCGGNVTWTLHESGLLVISGRGAMTDTSGWGDYEQQICAVVIEEGVTSLPDSAFSGLDSITYISVPASVTEIADRAFAYCYGLEQVVFGGSAPEMGYKVFDDISLNCYYPAGVWDYSDRICYGGFFVNWRPYTIHEPLPTEPEPTEPEPTEPEPTEPPVVDILGSGFCGDNVTWRMTDDGVLTIIGTGAMEDYPEEYPGWDQFGDILTKVIIQEGVTAIGDYAFWGYRNIKEVQLPDSLRTIGGVAFGYCAGLTEITIPAGVTEMKDYAFAECTGLERITFEGSAPAFGAEVFLDVDAMAAYPVNDSSWNDETRQDYGGMLSWLLEGTPLGLELLYAPAVTSYVVGETVDLSGIWVEATYGDGSVVLLKSGAMTLESGDTSKVGVSTATASYEGLTVEFPIYVHASRQTVALDAANWPESPHDYGSNMNDSQYVSYNGADSLSLTFSEATFLEPGYDYINIYDAYDNEIASFTGGEAAGVTVVVSGGRARIQLVSDESYTYYGYSLTSVTADIIEHTGEAIEGVEADCYADGRTSGILCDICGQTVGGQIIPALGHEWGEWKPMDNSSDMYRTCGICGDYDYLSVDQIFTWAGDSEYDELTIEEIRALYETIDWDMAAAYETAPNASAPYAIGRLSDESLDNLTAQVNFFRRLARLDSVRWDEELVEYAQAASMVNAATDTLSHYPMQPSDMDDATYETGAAGASSSNLAWGTHMGMMESVLGYLDDSDISNIDALGHRRWVLNPNMGATGFGVTSAGAWSHYHAMYAFDSSNTGYSNADFTAFPGGNRVYPNEFFSGSMAWSVQLNPDSFRTPNPDEVLVTLTRVSDGTQWIFSNQAENSEAGFFNVDTVGYGDSYAVIFRPADVEAYQGVYKVMVSGLRTNGNEMAAISYEVDFQSIAQTHVHTPILRNEEAAVCTEPGYTGDTYCADCGELLEQGQAVDPLGHAYENGTCIRCGHQDVLMGDVNGDSAVNSDDAIHLLYHTLFGDLYPVNQDCDFNGDGTVDSDDAIHLLYHTLFGDLYPLN